MSDRDSDLVTIVNELREEVRRIRLESAMRTPLPPGFHAPWPAKRLPSGGWLWADGAAVSRTTYVELFETIVPLLGTLTVTIASPGVFTLANHGLVIGDAVYLTTTGALPTGLSANTIYYVMTVPTSSTFTLGASRSTTAVTSAKNTSGSQSGVHSIYSCPWGLGNGTTTFNVPLINGKTIQALDAYGSGNAGLLSWLDAIGLSGGEETHQLTSTEMPSHTHTQNSHNHTQDAHTHTQNQHRHDDGDDTGGNTVPDAVANGFAAAHQEPGAGTAGSKRTGFTTATNQNTTATNQAATATNQNTGGDGAHNTMQPTVLLPWIVKT